MSRVTDMEMSVVRYVIQEGACTGTNLTYRIDGRRSSSRVPWVATSAAAETARIENLLKRTNK